MGFLDKNAEKKDSYFKTLFSIYLLVNENMIRFAS